MNGNTFKVGDYAFFTKTPSQLQKPGVVCEVTPYKVIQVVTKLIGATVYNTKHGSFTERDVGVTVFGAIEKALCNLKK